MDNKRLDIKIVIIAIILLAILLAIILMDYFNIDFPKFNNEIIENENIIDIRTEPTDLNVQYFEKEYSKDYKGKIVFNDDKIVLEGSGVTNSGNEVKITSGGSFYVTGTSTDANIVVEASKDADVQLVLDNCDIISKTTAPINAITCNLLTITLLEDSKNIISDTGTYMKFTDTEKEEPDGTIFTKTDLLINGTGTLTVNSNYLDGIVSKDVLQITKGANVIVNAKDDGIRSKDYVAINSANIIINAGGDGIKATNTNDTSLGFIKLEGGNFDIMAGSDGIEAETVLNISNNPIINVTSSNNKGIKAGNEITIESAEINILSDDDALHSNGIIIINNGNFELSSGDDGIHADTNIIINDGNINITKSYEGIESSYIEINGGTINLVASDDGINVAGGRDGSSLGGRIGQNNFTNMTDSNLKLVIKGGDITVNASGDGLDSNGGIYMYGGSVLVKGPTSNADAPLDFDREMVIDGGMLIAYGAAGMFENPSSNSKQNIIVYGTNGNIGDKIEFKDTKGDNIASFEVEKNYQVIVLSSNNIKMGEIYKIYVNDEEKESIEISSVITTNGSNFGGGMRGRGFDKNFNDMPDKEFGNPIER